MYAYIKGVLACKHDDYIIVEAYGIGYRIHTALSTIQAAGQAGSEIKLLTHLNVREDNMSLYGFLTQEELGMFELLLSVSGIGPKVAISILSSVSPSKFGLAVITDDAKTLTRAQGVGNKMAQRIILELKDKIKKEQLADIQNGISGPDEIADNGSSASEAISALIVLGYSPNEARRAVSAVFSDDMDVESVIRGALKNLAR